MKDLRQAIMAALIGHTGVGKTSLLLNLAKQIRRSQPSKTIIVSDPHDVFYGLGIHDVEISMSDESWAERLMQRQLIGKNKQGQSIYGDYKFKDSTVMLDDYRSLLKGNHLSESVLNLIMLRRRIGMDMFYSTHNPRLVLERFAYFTNYYFLFYTESDAGDFSDRIPKASLCQKGANLINKYVMSIGGSDSPTYRSLYPDFPYVLIKTFTDSLEAINMDKKIVEKLYN